ncbi:hypothetical protein Nepgr_001987 [Nepenthes gracilis]|uniref:Uncharacterized protein n=1 Tax=Nepenthes gracilis TaxID=150966 RepID=A0AAD3P652_NEPGR|nr:hypothetical protein Nepgr_001987 [Nepenthes gracilis]
MTRPVKTPADCKEQQIGRKKHPTEDAGTTRGRAGMSPKRGRIVYRLKQWCRSEWSPNRFEVNGNFEASNQHLAKYLAKVKEATWRFDRLTLVYVPKIENWKADQLVRVVAVENPEQYSRDKRKILSAPNIEE